MTEIVPYNSVPETLTFEMEVHASNATPLVQARRMTAAAAKDGLAQDAAAAGYEAVAETFRVEWRQPFDGVAIIRARLVDLVRAVAYQRAREEIRARAAAERTPIVPNARGVIVIPRLPGVTSR